MIDPKAIDKERSTALKQRIDLNRKARFGLQDATSEQLNIIFLICRHLDLDPLEDITILHGHPFYTINGTFRMMRRHPEYAGFKQWPLSQADKEAGGWEPTDIVWATEINTKSWGPIVQWGKVTQEELAEGQRRKTPLGTYAVEMAQKRSAQRAIRAAFGHEAAPDEQQIEQMMAEEIAKRQDPVRVKQLSDRYEQIYGGEDEWAKPKQLPQEAEPEPQPVVTQCPLCPDTFTGTYDEHLSTSPRHKVREEPEDFGRARRLEEQLSAEAEADAQVDPAGIEEHRLSLAWQRNRALVAQAGKLKLRPRTLRNTATRAEVEGANKQLEEQIANAEVPF